MISLSDTFISHSNSFAGIYMDMEIKSSEPLETEMKFAKILDAD